MQIPQTALGGWAYNGDHVQRNFEAYPQVPYQNITQGELLQYNMYASMKMKETPEPVERLDSREWLPTNRAFVAHQHDRLQNPEKIPQLFHCGQGEQSCCKILKVGTKVY